MKNYLFRIGLLLMVSVPCSSCTESYAQATTNKELTRFRITGYLLVSNIESGAAANFDFSKINYLNIAFMNPGRDGNYLPVAALTGFIAAAHKHDVKVLASIGGGMAPSWYTSLLSDTMRDDFVKKTAQFALDYDLDGIDVDLEGERIDNNYERFITGLSASLKLNHKIITAAVATVYKTAYTDRALSQLDFINIMSYDKTGPWNPANPGQHSPYQMVVEDLDYWTNTRGIAKERLSVGMPFYGYGFGPGAPPEMSYKKIVAGYPGAQNTDSVTVATGGTIYYNGIATIKAKTQLALQNAGGVMVWQLMQDSSCSESLLNTIKTTVSLAGK